MARKKIYKLCLQCNKPFVCDTKNARKKYCCIKCGLLNRSRQRKIDIEKLRNLVEQNVDIYKICDILNETYYVVKKAMSANGIKYPKKPYKLREDGYWNYNTDKNHRKIVEQFIGRKLLKSERVHHIDGDKTNNDISNLCLLESESEHSRLHKQLEQLALELFKQGIICFDPKEKAYKIKEL